MTMMAVVPPDQNNLLAALPDDVKKRLFPYIDLVYMPMGTVIYEPGDEPNQVYFPVDSIVSLLHVMENGSSAEIAVVGKEGVVGIPVILGGLSTTSRAVVHRAGWACLISSDQVCKEFNRLGKLHALMLRYTQSLLTQIAQTAVCNRHHSIEQQVCRLMLLSLDRLSDNHLSMTQELMANMLGVRREGVTEAAGRLQKKGIIRYRRGDINVLDRRGLEQHCCECYAVVRNETTRLLQDLPMSAN